jgi:hypothetical protein
MMAEDLDLVLERELDAPRDLVWKAQTQAEHLKHWFAPKPYEISEAEVDLRPGGIFRIRGVATSGRYGGYGQGQGQVDLVWKCRTDYRGMIVDVDVDPAQSNYGYGYNGYNGYGGYNGYNQPSPYDYSQYGYRRY